MKLAIDQVMKSPFKRSGSAYFVHDDSYHELQVSMSQTNYGGVVLVNLPGIEWPTVEVTYDKFEMSTLATRVLHTLKERWFVVSHEDSRETPINFPPNCGKIIFQCQGTWT